MGVDFGLGSATAKPSEAAVDAHDWAYLLACHLARSCRYPLEPCPGVLEQKPGELILNAPADFRVEFGRDSCLPCEALHYDLVRDLLRLPALFP